MEGRNISSRQYLTNLTKGETYIELGWEEDDNGKFWLEFQIFDDGLDSQHAQELASRRTKALEASGDGSSAYARPDSNDDFHHFQHLPTELRLKIWDYLIAPRILQIQCFEGFSEVTVESIRAAGRYALPLRRRKCPPHSLIPVVLHVNRESRSHGLKHYELSFSWKVPHVLAGADILGSGPSASHMSNVRGHGRAASESQAMLQSKSQQQEQQSELPTWSEPQIYFNYALDAVYLVGELEPYNRHGFNSPMTYFLRKEDCLRVRHVAVAFDALHYGETASQQIFGTLFHIVDRFHPSHNHVLITVQPSDEITHVLLGADRPLIPGFSLEEAAGLSNNSTHSPGESDPMTASERASYDAAGPSTDGNNTDLSARQTIFSGITRELQANTSDDNLIQKLWLQWYRGSLTTSSLASVRFDLVHARDLGGHIEDLEISLLIKDKRQRELDHQRKEDEYHNPPAPPDVPTNGEHAMRMRSMTMTSFADEEEDYASIPPGLEALALR